MLRWVVMVVSVILFAGCLSAAEVQKKRDEYRVERERAAKNYVVCSEMLSQDRFHCEKYLQRARYFQCLEDEYGESYCARYNGRGN